jgi:hypothetical protein
MKKTNLVVILLLFIALLTACEQARTPNANEPSSMPNEPVSSVAPTERTSSENNDSEMLQEAPNEVTEHDISPNTDEVSSAQNEQISSAEATKITLPENDENLILEVADSLNPQRLDSVEQSLEPYIQFGISLDRATGLMMYDGKPVREIRDDIVGLLITESAGPNGFGGRDISDAIDLTVVYEGDIPVGFRASTQEEYDKNTEERSK